MSEQLPETDRYARARELQRRWMATSAFVGIDPLHYSCDGPPLPPPEERERPTDPQTDEGRQYGEDVTAIALGKETYGYRNR